MWHRILACASALPICASAQAAPVHQAFGSIQQGVEVSDGPPQGTTVLCDPGWENLPGATAKLTIPAGANQLLTARFTGRGIASGPSGAHGAVRIVMGTREMLPIPLYPEFYYVTPANTSATFALERSLWAVPGTHSVTVQYCASGQAGAEFDVWAWHLTVEAALPPPS